ncbi:hypothetical protein F5Y10DRAFT_228676 [Nemania abortiva]|nr:hypothetical protein F5Y10DRAFT_228676 [Nemania abortiva]
MGTSLGWSLTMFPPLVLVSLITLFSCSSSPSPQILSVPTVPYMYLARHAMASYHDRWRRLENPRHASSRLRPVRRTSSEPVPTSIPRSKRTLSDVLGRCNIILTNNWLCHAGI